MENQHKRSKDFQASKEDIKSGRTKTLFNKHALEKDILSLFALISNADLFIKGSETRFNEVHSAHAIRGESDAGA